MIDKFLPHDDRRQQYFGIGMKNSIFIIVPLIVYVVISIKIILNCQFVAEDLPIIFFSQKNPLSFFTYWEYGLKELIPDPKLEVFRYRPLTSYIFYLTSEIAGLRPSLWAMVSHAVHLINYFILVQIFREIQKLFNKENKTFCYLIALFYLFYPGNVTNVAWVSGRIDLFVIFFCLMAFYYAIKYITGKKIIFLCLNIVSFYLATLTKENGVSYVVIELLMLYIIKLLISNKPDFFKIAIKIFFIKLSVLLIYFIQRKFVAGINDTSFLDNFNFVTYFVVFVKSLLFTILPIDSGSFIDFFYINPVASVVVYILFFACIGFVLIFCFSGMQQKIVKVLLAGVTIALTTLIFYISFGGATYRLFALTFTSLIIFVFILLTYNRSLKKPFNKWNLVSIAGIVLWVFFFIGYLNIAEYWNANFKIHKESLNSLTKLYDPKKENLIITYPHSLGQTYCFSDIGTYIYFEKNGTIGRYNNVTELAAINSYNEKDYNGGCIVEKNNAKLVVSSNNDNYLSPGAFFTQKSFIGENYSNLKNYSMEVLKINEASKPVSVMLKPKHNSDTNSVQFIKFINGKFERF